jgi:DNA-binding Lrp family transcriptional regulator
MLKLTIQDKKLLYELESNSRKSISRLSKRLGINRTTITYKINRLEKIGIITGFNTIIDIGKLGFKGYRIYFKFVGTNLEKEIEIFKWIANQNNIFSVQECDGAIDASIISFVKKDEEFERFLIQLKQRYKPYLDKINICRYLKTHHYKRDYLLNEKKDYEIITIGTNEQIACDELNWSILQKISLNTRKPIIEIADELNISVKTIANRIKQLEKQKIIKGYTISIDPRKMGREYYKVNITLNNIESYKKLLEYTKSIIQSIYVDETFSNFDYELNIEVKNKDEFNKIIEKIKEDFNGIRSYEYFTVKKTHKLIYLPNKN